MFGVLFRRAVDSPFQMAWAGRQIIGGIVPLSPVLGRVVARAFLYSQTDYTSIDSSMTKHIILIIDILSSDQLLLELPQVLNLPYLAST